jgi:hypothetical protein
MRSPWHFTRKLRLRARLYVPRFLPREVHQEIGYATTSDGIKIAYGTSGKGSPVIIVVGFMTHLELGVFSPTYDSAFLKPFARHLVVQYDGRGFGMSDFGVKDYSVEARVRDIEAVVDALKLPPFCSLCDFGGWTGCDRLRSASSRASHSRGPVRNSRRPRSERAKPGTTKCGYRGRNTLSERLGEPRGSTNVRLAVNPQWKRR